ncbi:MAG: hypothetical protein GY829_10995 [Gammaproteobacteria bacterium]|nr:hypothetical protein [Gammaproteobacteria bacterium]
MSKKKCKNCGSWDDVNKDGMGIGLCNAADELFRCSEWDPAFEPIQINDDCKDTMMFCQDGSDYKASLYTRAEHYCSCWSVRGQEK